MSTGFEGPLTYAKFAGGQSNPTYRIDTPARAYVLRRKPFGPILPSAHAVDREYRVIAGLHPTGFPGRRGRMGCARTTGVIGAAVLRHGDGRGADDLGRVDARHDARRAPRAL